MIKMARDKNLGLPEAIPSNIWLKIKINSPEFPLKDKTPR
jgi:hypothetical protein